MPIAPQGADGSGLGAPPAIARRGTPLTTTKVARGIGALILFAALAGIMYLTRNLDWSGLLAMPPTT